MAKQGEKPKVQIPGWLNFVIGGMSGMQATCIVQPMDLLKTRCQLLKGNQSFVTVAQNIVKNEGIMGFYNGISAALLRQATYSTARLGLFNGFLDKYRAMYGEPIFPIKICMGMAAGGIGALVGVPAEVTLIRMTADGRLPPDQRRNYKHVFDALIRITREEGIGMLWSGTGATVSRAIVVNGAQLSSYAQARQHLLPYLSEGFPLHLCSAMISGFVTSVASLPVDIVKTRVQNAGKGASQVGVLLDILKKEGPFALWSGFFPTLGKIGPHTVFTFLFLEQWNALYVRYVERQAQGPPKK